VCGSAIRLLADGCHATWRFCLFQFSGQVSAVVSWDPSLHDSISLNRVTPHGDRVYVIIKVLPVRETGSRANCQRIVLRFALRKRFLRTLIEKNFRTISTLAARNLALCFGKKSIKFYSECESLNL